MLCVLDCIVYELRVTRMSKRTHMNPVLLDLVSDKPRHPLQTPSPVIRPDTMTDPYNTVVAILLSSSPVTTVWQGRCHRGSRDGDGERGHSVITALPQTVKTCDGQQHEARIQ